MKRMLLKLIIIASLLLAALAIYAFKIEPFTVKVQEINVNNTGTQELKVVQFSDTHISKAFPPEKLAKIVTAINEQEADIVIFSGDLFDNYAKFGYGEETAVADELAKINATYGKFAVWGNHDYGGGASRVFEETLTASGFQILKNNGTNLLLENNQQVFIGGLDDSLMGNSSVEETLATRETPAYSILVTHEPDIADQFVGMNGTNQLILSGHSHGGQIWLPFYQMKNTLAKKYSKGSYQLADDTLLYVNTGIGTTMIHARFFTPPEVTVFKINI